MGRTLVSTPLAGLALAALALTLAASRAAAQGRLPLQLGLGGGITHDRRPPGTFGDDGGDRAGHAVVALALQDRRSPVGVRAEAIYQRSPERTVSGLCARAQSYDSGPLTCLDRVVSHVTTLAATLDGTLTFARDRRVAPYVVAGVGTYYRLYADAQTYGCRPGAVECAKINSVGFREESQADQSIGLNAGVGVRLRVGGLAAFAELRRHQMLPSDRRLVPLTVGLWF